MVNLKHNGKVNNERSYFIWKVSIDPPDAVESTLEVEKVGEPPGPAQAPFYGLLPGSI